MPTDCGGHEEFLGQNTVCQPALPPNSTLQLIDRILSVKDNSSEREYVAVPVTGIDWKKALPMQDHTLGVQSFNRNGVRASLIPIVSSFFQRRTMRVAWRLVDHHHI